MIYIADRITIDNNICNDKPTIKGKRIAMQTILELLSAGDSLEEILRQYLSLELDEITTCMKFAAVNVHTVKFTREYK